MDSWYLNKGEWLEYKNLSNTKGLLAYNTGTRRELQPLIIVENIPKMSITLHGPIWIYWKWDYYKSNFSTIVKKSLSHAQEESIGPKRYVS